MLTQTNSSAAPSASGGGAGSSVETVAVSSKSATGAGQGKGGGFLGIGGMEPMLMVLLMFAVFYLLLIRPQQKKAKEHQKMLDGIGKGEEIITNGGIIGRVVSSKGNILSVEVADRVRVKVLRTQIAGRYENNSAKASDSKKSDSKVEKK